MNTGFNFEAMLDAIATAVAEKLRAQSGSGTGVVPIQPRLLFWTSQLRLGVLRQAEAVPGVGATRLLVLAALREAVESELADRLQHREPGAATRLVHPPDETRVEQRAAPCQNVVPLGDAVANFLGRDECPPRQQVAESHRSLCHFSSAGVVETMSQPIVSIHDLSVHFVDH